MPENLKKAVVLLSGGLDSTTTLAIAKSEGYSLLALSFDYGQRHDFEIKAARKIAATYGVLKHIVSKIDLRESHQRLHQYLYGVVVCYTLLQLLIY